MADWIILDKTTGIGSDEVTITVSSYSELVERLKNLVFTTTDNKASDTCVVRQYGESGYLKVIPSSINMVYSGGYVDVTVSSTEDWTIGGLPSWITCNSLGGKKGDTVIRLTISANTAASDRSYNISFTSANYNATLSVTQAKYEEGGIVPPSINPDDCEGGTFTVRITADGCWSFNPDEPSPTPDPICEDALVWGTYVPSTIDKVTGKLNINGNKYTPTVDGINWALCTWTGGTIVNLSNFMRNPINIDYKEYQSVNLSNLHTGNVTDMNSMFTGCSELTSLDVSGFDTSSVTDMQLMFYDCSRLASLDLSNFDTSNVSGMTNMFGFCSGLTTLDLSNFNTSKVKWMSAMFQNCQNLTSLNLSSFNTSNVTNMNMMFRYCEKLTSLDLSNFNTGNVTDMGMMFQYCEKLTSLDLSNFNTGNVTDMENMFRFCSGLTRIDVSSFNTSNIPSMGGMFGGCSKLASLDLSNFNTEKVYYMRDMFEGCSKLASLDLSNFNLDKITDTSFYLNSMFSGCDSLTTVKVINCNDATQQKILTQLKTDLPSYTWTLSGGIITRS